MNSTEKFNVYNDLRLPIGSRLPLLLPLPVVKYSYPAPH